MNGDINMGNEEGFEELSLKETRKVEKEIQRLENQHQPTPHQKRTLKGTSTAVRLAQRLSPKSHRKLMTEESLIKVISNLFLFIYLGVKFKKLKIAIRMSKWLDVIAVHLLMKVVPRKDLLMRGETCM